MAAANDPDATATLVNNERLKARAAYLNGIAIAIFAIGALAPLAASVSTLSTPSLAVAVLSLNCVLLSYALQYAAMNVLRGLKL